jgi:hypothetical protein
MRNKNIVAFFVTIILVSCSSVATQVPTLEVLATSTFLPITVTEPKPTLTQTLSPKETATISSSLVTERLCTAEDFNSSSEFTGLDDLETLRGYHPEGDWIPAEGWEETIGIYNPKLHYAIAGFRNSEQHLYLLVKILCRYGENGKYGISEITDFIWIPALEEDEIVIWNPTFESCCFLQSNIKDRLEFRWEWFVTSECNPSVPTAIMVSKYDLAGLPQKITVGDGYKLPVKVTKAWAPNTDSNKFEELSTENMSCVISFNGG